ncbi:FAD-dependent thymidylate synthase [Bacillus mycoides]|uniref:FAD-dependent thymidylate synthase n=1 Tax=Bacillus mycoides TaxID=1405 RepID=UPI0011EC537B|nr:FAD-dependent thymidylate synthase [Bacillus mycoides]QEL88525.1 FAD-dependent thymidylate synthase [Bacillus mycoides]
MDLKLLAHTQLSEEFYGSFDEHGENGVYESNGINRLGASDGQAIALSAIRTCYSPNKPSEIVALEGEKYFRQKATEGEGKEVDRLIRHIVGSGHTSTLEHLTYTFSVEGVSRALLAQLTRHRVGFSFSVQSQRYVKQSTDSKHGGFDYVVPEKVKAKGLEFFYDKVMENIQAEYDYLIGCGVPQEDARSVLPNAATTNLVLTVNLRSLLDFYSKRKKGKGAQHEITELAERLREEVVKVEPWTDEFFKN